ncbi:dihydrofolate reductase family protein [Marmoricola sp. URHB0036]|uniref:dihydrofolate reductase family protein n=1 Tax=Marmoricola sp. URHB0036 TaxID=1298863 RepID=UPI0003F5896F|nr:dihydrofolate reductase family protein [Marmoricola sp. URHB0036]
MATTRGLYFTAMTLDGFLADEHDSLDWLFEQQTEEGGPAGYEEFIKGVGAITMGATTYQWVRDHLERSGEPWPYEQPCWVFTHRDFEPVDHDVRFVAGAVEDHYAAIAESAGDRDIWVCGGGDLAGQFADIGRLQQVIVAIAPVTLGAGRPLFPRQHDFKLVELGRNGDFLTATYDVVGPRPG